MTKAPPTVALPQQLNEQEVYYDIRVRNEKILKKAQSNNGSTGGNKPSNPFDF